MGVGGKRERERKGGKRVYVYCMGVSVHFRSVHI